jgi:hypothetical protein
MTCVVSGTATMGVGTANPVTFAAGDTIAVQVVRSAAPAVTQTTVSWTAKYG